MLITIVGSTTVLALIYASIDTSITITAGVGTTCCTIVCSATAIDTSFNGSIDTSFNGSIDTSFP
jgi:hypothetical protein